MIIGKQKYQYDDENRTAKKSIVPKESKGGIIS